MTYGKDDDRLSQFGQVRIEQIAKEHANQVDCRTSVWHYWASTLLELVMLASALGLGLTVLLVITAPVIGWPLQVAVDPLVTNTAAFVVARILYEFVPDPWGVPDV